MSGFKNKNFNISGIRDKVKATRDEDVDIEKMYKNSFSWQAISQAIEDRGQTNRRPVNNSEYNFSGKVLRGGKYGGEDLQYANFAAADLKEVNFSKAQLQGADFTGADLSGADLSEANLDGAIFSGAKLRGTNFTGAKMNGVVLVDADIQDAILLNVEMDQLALEELQALVEYLAVYYPHKLNLSRMNLTMLDFTRIDLSRVNLRGVDFTGVDFTGVNIFDLDLSECIISPEQIAQALGRVPTPLELKKILAPKPKKKDRGISIDFSAFFDGRGTVGVWDLTKHPGITVADLLKKSKEIYKAVTARKDPKDAEILAKFQQSHDEKQDVLAKEHNEQMRKAIEEHKREVREMSETKSQHPKADIRDYEAEELAKKNREQHLQRAKEQYLKQKQNDYARDAVMISRARGQRERG